MKLSSFKKVVFVAMVLLVLPIAGCAAKEPPAPPPPPPAPPAGTIAVNPAAISYATLEALLPGFAQAVGLPPEAVPGLPPALSVLALPVKFTGSGWPADELVTIDMVIPADVEMKGLDRERGEDSVGIAMATADADGNFEVSMESVGKVNWLLRCDWLPIVKPDLSTTNPIPNDTYTLRAVGLDPRTVTTTTWDLELLPPEAAEEPAAEEPVAEEPAAEEPAAAPPAAAGELSYEAAVYTNADYGFSVMHPVEWAPTPSESGEIDFVAQAATMVPVMFVDIEEGANFIEALTTSMTEAGGTNINIGDETETTLADGTPAFETKFELTLSGFPGVCFALGVQLDDGAWVCVIVGTVDMLVAYDQDWFSEIVHTIQFD